MKSLLLSSLVLALFGITLTSSEKLTDENLRKLYNTIVSPKELVNNIFTLPAPQQLYVYEYLRDLRNNVDKDSKMIPFLNTAFKLMQAKIDAENEKQKLEKVSVKQYFRQRIDQQLRIPYKKTIVDKATTSKLGSSLNKAATVDKSSKKSQLLAEKNTSSKLDTNSEPRNLVKPSTTELKITRNPLINPGTLKNITSSSELTTKPPLSDKIAKLLPKSNSEISQTKKKPSPSGIKNIPKVVSSTSTANDKKLSSSSDFKKQTQLKITPDSLPKTDKPQSTDLKKSLSRSNSALPAIEKKPSTNPTESQKKLSSTLTANRQKSNPKPSSQNIQMPVTTNLTPRLQFNSSMMSNKPQNGNNVSKNVDNTASSLKSQNPNRLNDEKSLVRKSFQYSGNYPDVSNSMVSKSLSL